MSSFTSRLAACSASVRIRAGVPLRPFTWISLPASAGHVDVAADVVHQQFLRSADRCRYVERPLDGLFILHLQSRPSYRCRAAEQGRDRRHRQIPVDVFTGFLPVFRPPKRRVAELPDPPCCPAASFRSAPMASFCLNCTSRSISAICTSGESCIGQRIHQRPPHLRIAREFRQRIHRREPHVYVRIVIQRVQQRLLHLAVGLRYLVAISHSPQSRAGDCSCNSESATSCRRFSTCPCNCAISGLTLSRPRASAHTVRPTPRPAAAAPEIPPATPDCAGHHPAHQLLRGAT